MTRSRRASIVLLVGVLLGLAATALAHADVPLIEGEFRLEPGEEFVVPTALHYHRLALRYRVAGADDTAFSLRVVLGSEPDALDDAPATATMLQATLAGSGSRSQLIPCCDGVAYQEMLLELRNDGDAPATLELRAWALHDEFAVVSTRVEPGAAIVPAALFGLLGLAAWGAVRGSRTRSHRVAGRAARQALRGSAALFGVAVVAVVALGATGMVRYGGGPVDGIVAVMADLPIPGGPFGSRAALAMGVLLLSWLTAHGLWYAAVASGTGVDATGQGSALRTRRLGAALAATSLMGGVSMGVSYGSWVPPILALLLVAPVVMVLGTLRRSAGTVGASGDLRPS